MHTQSMYFFHQPLVDYAVAYFQRVEFVTPGEGDAFWGLFAPGNTKYLTDRPFERFSDYEEMLLYLRDADQLKYERMHKGTPFYFMSWLAFDLRNYEKGLFYIDSAIAEDVRKTQGTTDADAWKGAPGARFLLLEPQDEVAQRAINAIRAALDREMGRFNFVSGRPELDLGSIRHFVTRLIEDPKQRTIISALYVFVLEFAERVRELDLRRGSAGGSNEPFTVHLFTGGLLFESLLKHYYPVNDAGSENRQLGNVFNTTAFQRDFNLGGPPPGSAATLREIHGAVAGANTIEVAFGTAAKLRNTTGHNLVWDDVFLDSGIYVELFHQIINAILFVVGVKGR